ncbi:endonuclease-reverse transcriptase [Plakobranchus ocellatus]|uniref:Endonuclease-reverse transcriptase n=1 Tax=Plakobranchus ocellatus TaxID=259542 RepID=A0AAV3Y379_9GAST|nr:endonuclease-reverse transcriptase [Plakobranchus ocellatus]
MDVAGNIRWTKRCTEWQSRSGRRDTRRPEARWMDNIRRAAGPQWQRKDKIGGKGRHLQRATSCSGWTKPPSNQVNQYEIKFLLI